MCTGVLNTYVPGFLRACAWYPYDACGMWQQQCADGTTTRPRMDYSSRVGLDTPIDSLQSSRTQRLLDASGEWAGISFRRIFTG